jgi:NAD(P)-dependent dehydrogenase (short-subunit alcohol dehydrogenase family)
MAELAGKVAFVTGAGSGVGRALSLRLVQEGTAVGVLGRRPEPLEALVAEIRGAGGQALALPADVSDELAINRAVAHMTGEFGGLDFLVICAAVGLYGPVENYTLAEWQATFATNVTGVFLCSRAVLPLLKQRGGGHIIAINSGAGKRGYANLAAYSASKFAVIGFMESLAEEVGALGIKCTTIVPGSILTEFGPRSIEQKRDSGKKYLLPEDVAEAIIQVLRQPNHAWIQEMNLWPF